MLNHTETFKAERGCLPIATEEKAERTNDNLSAF
jgi:hypothetical protein